MDRKPLAALAVTLFVAGTLGVTAAQAKEPKLAATALVSCYYGAGAEFFTRVAGVETAGPVPDGLVVALSAEPACAGVESLLAKGGFELVHRLAGPSGDFDDDGDVDGRDFLVWQRGSSPAAAKPSERPTTVLLRCSYMVADEHRMTRVVGSEIAGPIGASLAAALAARPSCTEAYAALAGAGFRLLSAPAAAGAVDAADYMVWQRN